MTDEPSYFLDEQAAFEKVEALRWPDGPVCVHCGAYLQAGRVTGRGARAGLWFCRACKRQFRVTIGTIFEDSHLPLNKWLLACQLVGLEGMRGTKLREHLQIASHAAVRMRRAIRAVLGSEPASSLDEILRRAFEVWV